LGSGKQIRSIELLGSESHLTFEQSADGLHVHLPEQAAGKYAYAMRIDFTSPGK
jgi:hypothetical protein